MARPREQLAFYSALTFDECERRLLEGADVAEFTLFSLSGWKGSKDLLVKLEGDGSFTLRKRRYYKNDFAPIFYGKLTPDGSATLIEGYFDVLRLPRIFIRVWMTLVALFGVFMIPTGIAELARNGDQSNWLFILVPSGMLLFGFLLTRLGWALGNGEQSFILDFIQNQLVATPTQVFQNAQN